MVCYPTAHREDAPYVATDGRLNCSRIIKGKVTIILLLSF